MPSLGLVRIWRANGVNLVWVLDDTLRSGAGAVVSPEVLAARLSRFLWQEEPDEALKAVAAAARSLEAVNELILSMLEDARARVGGAAFFSSRLRLGDLPSVPKKSVELPLALVVTMQKEAPPLAWMSSSTTMPPPKR